VVLTPQTLQCGPELSSDPIAIHHHHHHHFWSAPLRVHSTTRSQQPSEQAILSHIECFSQCEIVGLEVSSKLLVRMQKESSASFLNAVTYISVRVLVC